MRFLSISLLIVVLIPFPLQADPPTSPPPCNVLLGPLFCFRTTDISRDVGDSNKFQFEFTVVNWTGTDAAGLILTLNTGPNPGGGVPAGAPRFSGGSIDANGRPIGPLADPPTGNLPTNNDWNLIGSTPTQLCFAGGTPIPHPQATIGNTTYHGLLDPTFAQATQGDCVTALTSMIPCGASTGGGLPLVFSMTPECIDDGTNVLDGFVVEIEDWDAGEQLSLNWWLIDADGNNLGIVGNSGAVLGNEFAFGTVNLARVDIDAPPPLFDQNSGYDPPNSFDSNLDSPLFWAENEVGGVDTYPMNPIPAGQAGQGTFFAVEFGAAVTAEFANDLDNEFLFNFVPVISGTNITAVGAGTQFIRGDINIDFGINIADVIHILGFLFPQGSPNQLGCEDSADINDDNVLNLGDPITLLGNLFPGTGGPPGIPLPNPNCGIDPTADSLSCDFFPGCP